MNDAADQSSYELPPPAWFEEWHEPGEFFVKAHEALKVCFSKDQVPPQHLRDAYVSGLFAQIWRDALEPCEIRLVPDAFPDAQLATESKQLELEVTLALELGKRMFEEWRERRAMAARGEYAPANTSEHSQAIVREALPRAVGQKALKHYAVPPTLLVYVNEGAALTSAEMAQLTEPWKDSFAGIYLLCGIDAVRVWPDQLHMRGTTPF